MLLSERTLLPQAMDKVVDNFGIVMLIIAFIGIGMGAGLTTAYFIWQDCLRAKRDFNKKQKDNAI